MQQSDQENRSAETFLALSLSPFAEAAFAIKPTHNILQLSATCNLPSQGSNVASASSSAHGIPAGPSGSPKFSPLSTQLFRYYMRNAATYTRAVQIELNHLRVGAPLDGEGVGPPTYCQNKCGKLSAFILAFGKLFHFFADIKTCINLSFVSGDRTRTTTTIRTMSFLLLSFLLLLLLAYSILYSLSVAVEMAVVVLLVSLTPFTYHILLTIPVLVNGQQQQLSRSGHCVCNIIIITQLHTPPRSSLCLS